MIDRLVMMVMIPMLVVVTINVLVMTTIDCSRDNDHNYNDVYSGV